MKLKSLLGALAVVILSLPFAITFIASSVLRSSLVQAPTNRFAQTILEVDHAVREGSEGGLEARPGWEKPDWIELVALDRGGRVVLSTLPSIEEEAFVPAATILGALAGGASSVYSETIAGKEGALGTLYAAVRPGEIRSRDRGRLVLLNLVLLGLLFVLSLLGSFTVAAYLARAVTRLEEAAARIACGDLESPVTVRGVREIRALSAAMDRMRAGLREEQARRSRFLAALSHDLRSPLTSLRGYLEALEDGITEDPLTLRRYFEIAQDKSRILEGRVDELLELARMETGEWRLSLAPLDLGEFLSRLAAEFAEDAKVAGRRFLASLTLSSPCNVMADERLLLRAFENLFTNALRYAPANSTILFRAGTAENRRDLVIALEDEGPGIPQEELDRIFEPYFRGAAATGLPREGLGLGLFIAAGIAHSHGWELKAASPAGGGARFSMIVSAAGAALFRVE